jgi:hypothetical protein
MEFVTYPAVPAPKELRGWSIDFKLKPGWRYDEAKGVFVDPKGVEFRAAAVAEKQPHSVQGAQPGAIENERTLQS